MIVPCREVFEFLSVLEAGNYIYQEVEFIPARNEPFLVFSQQTILDM